MKILTPQVYQALCEPGAPMESLEFIAEGPKKLKKKRRASASAADVRRGHLMSLMASSVLCGRQLLPTQPRDTKPRGRPDRPLPPPSSPPGPLSAPSREGVINRPPTLPPPPLRGDAPPFRENVLATDVPPLHDAVPDPPAPAPARDAGESNRPS